MTGPKKLSPRNQIVVPDLLPSLQGSGVHAGYGRTVAGCRQANPRSAEGAHWLSPMFQAMKPGEIWTEETFLSSAYSPAGAMQKEMVLRLTSKSGVVLDKVSVVPHELEVLFKPGTRFKPISVIENSKWEIVAEEQ